MNQPSNKRRIGFANKLHAQIFLLVSAAAVIPAAIAAVALYYLIFGITAEQVAIPEAIAYNIIPAAKRVVAILMVATPIAIVIILAAAYKISHAIVGPFDRIIRDLDDRVAGVKQGPIVLRKGDKFQPLVDRINKLL